MKFFTWQKLRKNATSGSDIWLGPVGGQRHAGVAAGDLEIRAADDRHLDLVVAARSTNLAKVEQNGIFPAAATPGRDADHVLLGDLAFEVLGGEFLGEPLGVRGVLHVGIETDDALVGRAQRDQRRAVRLARRDRLAGGQILVQADHRGYVRSPE